jgi:hypothetical protein
MLEATDMQFVTIISTKTRHFGFSRFIPTKRNSSRNKAVLLAASPLLHV